MRLFILVIVLSGLFLFAPVAVHAEKAPAWVPGQLLVKWRDQGNVPAVRSKTVSRAAASVSSAKATASVIRQYPSLGIEQWQTGTHVDPVQLAAELNNRDDVLFAEPNYRRYPRLLPTDSLTSLGRYAQMQLPDAWDTTQGDRNVKVAVIDDAFDMSHEDLKANWNTALAWDFIDNDNDPSPGVCIDPDSGQQREEIHGTLVAGLLAAANNDFGIVGAAPGIQLIPLRIGCLFSVATELAAIEYAIEQGVDIINISYGGPMYSEAERDAILRLADNDILLVAAAGNFENNNDLQPDYPSGVDLPNVLSVAATDADNRLSVWTQYGATSVDVAAPGVDLVSTRVNSTYSEALEGTSFSAPLVAGTAALIKSLRPQSSFRDLKGAIMSSVDPLNRDLARTVTDGQVNANAALFKVRSPEPVVVINHVELDDNDYGNQNSWADPFEFGKLNLTLENIWAAASNDIVASLHAENADVSILTEFQRYDALDPLLENGKQTRSFWVRFPEHKSFKEIIFRLDLETVDGHSLASRRFSLPSGTLNLHETVTHTINRVGQRQDNVHYYRIDVPSARKDLIFQLHALNGSPVSKNLDILVRHGELPLFDYTRYSLPDPVRREGVIAGTVVGAHTGLYDEVIINNPKAGSYYVAVIQGPDVDMPDIQYELYATWHTPRLQLAAGGGCTISRAGGGMFDPILPLLAMLSAFLILTGRQRKPTEAISAR